MKTTLNILVLFVLFQSSAQTTVIPDPNFEQALVDLGLDNIVDGSVVTANISNVDTLDVSNSNISSLIGIENFSSITHLWCHQNQLTNLDITQNSQLAELRCSFNQLVNLDVSQNSELTILKCGYNQITSLDISQNSLLELVWCVNNQLTSLDVATNTLLTDLQTSINNLGALDISQNSSLRVLSCYLNQLSVLDISNNLMLEYLFCNENNLSSLDVSQHSSLIQLECPNNFLTDLDLSANSLLTELICTDNELVCLNVKNGNNTNMVDFYATNNPNLSCIEVDDAAWSTANWSSIDAQASFSNYCANACSVGIEELSGESKELIKIIDLVGRETEEKPNTLLIYVYSDGTTEKVFRVE